MDNTVMVNNALEYIKQNFARSDLTLAQIADHAGFSIYYFDRLFLESTGYTVMDYVRRQRLVRAALLLKRTDMSVMDIALEVGFETGESFAKAFKRYFGKTPRDYRKDLSVNIDWSLGATGISSNRLNRLDLGLKQISLDHAVEYLLNENPYQNAIWADVFKSVPSIAYTLAQDEEPKEFLILSDYYPDQFAFSIFADTQEAYAEYIKKTCQLPGTSYELMCDDIAEIMDLTQSECDLEASYYLSYAYLSDIPLEYQVPHDMLCCELGEKHLGLAEDYSRFTLVFK